MYPDYNTDQIHMLFIEFKKYNFTYIYGRKEYDKNNPKLNST
jgi:hypothetical protein